MTQTLEIPKTVDNDNSDHAPRVMHIVKRDPATGLVIEPKIALCGKMCEKALGGRPAGGILCERCEAMALQGWGASPTR
ncbi:MAG: hypothetical protein FJX76_22840 [Armatimonadetes bacterium]|nr:hypothetical protein [Armatimonadota bacterium]